MPEDDTQRATVEIQRLIEETRKFVAEQHKLLAETQKLNRDRWLAPALAIASVIGGLLGTATFIATIIHG